MGCFASEAWRESFLEAKRTVPAKEHLSQPWNSVPSLL